jgi:hypothetical protein
MEERYAIRNRPNRRAILDKRLPVCDHAHVAKTDPDDPRLQPVRRAANAMEAAEKMLKEARATLAAEIVVALNAGVRPVALKEVTPYSQDYLRKIARDAGVEPLRPPTVTSIRKLQELQDGTPD